MSNNLYPKLQAADQQSHNKETALLRVHNDILKAIDNKNEVILVLLGLSAAFDTIDHDIVVTRLQTQFGFTGIAHQWFESYIHDRYQKVVIGYTESRPQTLAFWRPTRLSPRPLTVHPLHRTPGECNQVPWA